MFAKTNKCDIASRPFAGISFLSVQVLQIFRILDDLLIFSSTPGHAQDMRLVVVTADCRVSFS